MSVDTVMMEEGQLGMMTHHLHQIGQDHLLYSPIAPSLLLVAVNGVPPFSSYVLSPALLVSSRLVLSSFEALPALLLLSQALCPALFLKPSGRPTIAYDSIRTLCC